MRRKFLVPVLLGLIAIAVSCGHPRLGTTPSGAPPAASARRYATVVIRPFSLEGARIQENPRVKEFAVGLPDLLARDIKGYLQSRRNPPTVIVGGKPAADSLVVEGSFLDITAGSTAARWIVGLGAGRSTVSARWVIKDGASGETLATHEEASHTGGTYTGMTAIESDADALARKVVNTLGRLLR
jgi:hypothetical protein